MSEDLEIRVKADTGEATANLQKTEKAVDGVTKSTEALDKKQGRLGDSMRQAGEGFNKVRSAALEYWGALSLGQTIGNAVAAVIDRISARMAVQDKRMNDAAVNTIKFQQAMKLAERGVIALGGSQEQFIARYDAYVAKISPVTRALEAQAKAMERLRIETEQVGQAIERAGKGMAFSFIDPAAMTEQENAVKGMAGRLNELLGKAFKEGGAPERDAWAKANEETVLKAIELFKKFGQEAPEHVKAAYEQMTAAADQAELFKGVNEQYEANVQKQREWRTQTDTVEEGMRKWTTATQGAGSAFGALSGDFTAINAEVKGFLEAGGQYSEIMVGMQTIALTVAQATERQNEAFREQIRLMGALREEQMKTLDVAQGWTDYLITLKEGYDSGVSSLAGYINSLAEFRSQLLRLFGGATGEAKKGLQDMLDLITQMIATVGPRGQMDFSYKGQLEKAFKERK